MLGTVVGWGLGSGGGVWWMRTGLRLGAGGETEGTGRGAWVEWSQGTGDGWMGGGWMQPLGGWAGEITRMLNRVCVVDRLGGLASRLSPGGLGWMVSKEIASHRLRDAPCLWAIGWEA